ncbi:hypothetical protein JCM11641_000598 [Rhodosporidiobolus odoratus]
MTIDVPIISLQCIKQPERRKEVAEQVGKAARDSGFFQIVDHGVSQDLIDSAFAMARQAFSLPLEEKQNLGGQALKGAIGIGHDDQQSNGNVADEGTPDLKEQTELTNKLPPDSLVPGMRDLMQDYYAAMLALSIEVMKLVALSLDMPEDTFHELRRNPAAALRLLHYPAELEGTGAGQHSDFGFCTILGRLDFFSPSQGAVFRACSFRLSSPGAASQVRRLLTSIRYPFGSFIYAATSGAPGLELHPPNSAPDTWIPVEPATGAFIVNVGDLLSLYTGGEYRSSLHRVMNKSGMERYSIPFFLAGTKQ